MLADKLSAAWTALTAEQRICWHFTAARTPSLNADDELTTENGWQWFVDINSPLAVIDEALILADPPTDDTQPPDVAVTTAAWPLPAKLGAGGSTRRAAPWIALATPMPTDTAAIVTQTYDEFRGAHAIRPTQYRVTLRLGTAQFWLTAGSPPEYVTLATGFIPDPIHENISRAPRVRHVTVIAAGGSGEFSLTEPSGYFATTAGANRFATIKGQTARRRPDLPLGKIRVINTSNGVMRKRSIPNPTGST